MAARRSGLQLKKEILSLLKERPCVISEMERKLGTSDRVLKRHLTELEYLGIVKLTRHLKSPHTGRHYVVAELHLKDKKV